MKGKSQDSPAQPFHIGATQKKNTESIEALIDD